MAVTVKIPTQLRAVTDGEVEVEVEGETVGEALDAVFDAHTDLRERITEDGTLRRFVNVFVSGEDIRFQDGLETPLADGDEVTILPAVAGGSSAPVHSPLSPTAEQLLVERVDVGEQALDREALAHVCPGALAHPLRAAPGPRRAAPARPPRRPRHRRARGSRSPG